MADNELFGNSEQLEKDHVADPGNMVGDLISRQAALDALGERPMLWINNDEYTLGARNQYDMDRLAIETVPSAQQWIPCSERLPEYGATVLTYNNDDEYEINHLIDKDDVEWFFNVAVAWMPLPEPWKGEQE